MVNTILAVTVIKAEQPLFKWLFLGLFYCSLLTTVFTGALLHK